jgi:hypothetical protein
MKVSDLTALLKKQFEIEEEIELMVNVNQIADLEHTLKQSGISEVVKIVIQEILMAQPVPVPIL